MISDSRSQARERYKGCLLGAVLGDALGMPYETLPSRPPQPLSFKKAYRGHPNELLLPGQYTDDGQLILISARILSESSPFDACAYAKELLRTHNLRKFRYADGAVVSACKKMESSKNLLGSGINSGTSGCISLAVPFSLAYADKKEMAKELFSACSITHANTTAQAGAVGLSLFLKTLADTGDAAAAFQALDTAAENMCPELYLRLSHAYSLAAHKTPLQHAAAELGTSSYIYQTLPLAAYLCRSFERPDTLLSAAVSCGGNAGTIAMICGAFAGARFGLSALPADLVRGVERAGIFGELAEKLYLRSHPESAADEGEPAEKDADETETGGTSDMPSDESADEASSPGEK